MSSDPARAGHTALAFDRARFLTTVTFESGQLLRALDREDFELVLIQMSPHETLRRLLVLSIRERTDAPLVTLSDEGIEQSLHTRSGADLQIPHQVADVDVVRMCSTILKTTGRADVNLPLRWGPLELDLGKRRAEWAGRVVRLTPMQLRIMEVLILAGGDVVSTRDLSRRVLGSAYEGDRSRVKAHIVRIRKVLRTALVDSGYLMTVRGEGFRLADYPLSDADYVTAGEMYDGT